MSLTSLRLLVVLTGQERQILSKFPHCVGVSLTLYPSISVPSPQIRGTTVCKRHSAVFYDRFSKLPFPVPDKPHNNVIIVLIAMVALVSHRNVPGYYPPRLGYPNEFHECLW